MRRVSAPWLVFALVGGCGDAVSGPPPTACDRPAVASGPTCVAPPLDPCPLGVPRAGGGCAPVGIDRCADGFVADGRGGCRAVLPATQCPKGEVAFLGETACHELVECGEAPYGSIARDADAIHVDAAAAPDGDGSAARPLRTLAAALAASEARVGATVPQIAVAAGSYVETNVVRRPVRIVGRCPRLVELRAAGDFLLAGAVSFEVDGVGVVSGGAGGLVAVGSGAEPPTLTVRRVWAHDGAGVAIGVQSAAVRASLVLRATSIEAHTGTGVALIGDADVDGLVVRDVWTEPGGGAATGVSITAPAAKAPTPVVRLERLVVERATYGVAHQSGTLQLSRVLLRDIGPGATDPPDLATVALAAIGNKARATLRASDVTIERATLSAVLLRAADVTATRLTIGDTRPGASGVGQGLSLEVGAVAEVDQAIVAGSVGAGVVVRDAALSVTRAWIGDVSARATGDFGLGVLAESKRAEASLVLTDVVVARTRAAGIQIDGASLRFVGGLVDDVRADAAGTFGDGLALQSATLADGSVARGRATLSGVVLRRLARGGLTVFDGTASLDHTLLLCAPVPLALMSDAASPELHDGGANLCGCVDVAACRARADRLLPLPRLGG